MENHGSEFPRLNFKAQIHVAAILVITVVVSVHLVNRLIPRRLAAPRQWDQGPILDARFIVGPLDPEPIDGTCPVHHLQLEEDVVRIDYGLIEPMEGEYPMRRDQFPFANSSYLGGCMVCEPTRAKILFCSECREAEKDWLESWRH